MGERRNPVIIANDRIKLEVMEKNNPENTLPENDIFADIIKYGKDILTSDIVQESVHETHHLHGTVFDHTINVCVFCMRLCYQLLDRNISVNKKDLIQAALCHDLGMVGRDQKYKNRVDAWKSHPKESARIARELVPGLSKEAEDIILSHMWPAAGPPPRSNEGMILCMADRYSTMAEWKTWLTEGRFASRIKDHLDGIRR